MTASALFWDRVAKRYSNSPVSNKEVYERKLEITKSYLSPESEIVELGCGTGSTALYHAPYVKHITAIDVSKNMLEIARQKAADANINNISFEQTTIDDFNAPDGSYDMVMAHSILHLVPNKAHAIKKAYNLLKPGGVFVSSTFCGRGKAKLLYPFLALGAFFGLLPKINFFSPESLQMSIKDAGFRLDHVWLPENSDALFVVALKPSR